MKVPIYGWRPWLRALIKGIGLLLIFDALFILLHPLDALLQHSIYGAILPRQTRIVPSTGDISYDLLPVETLLSGHRIALPKAPDEFRIVILGDSGINGWGTPDDQTITGLLTRTSAPINGKRVIAYNLAFFGPSAMRDLIIADASLKYQPDLIVLFVTLIGFQNRNPDLLIAANLPRMTRLTQQFNLTDINAQTYGHYEDAWWQRSIFMQRTTLYRWVQFQAKAFEPHEMISVTNNAKIEPLPPTPVESSSGASYAPVLNPSWAALSAISHISTTPVLIVNEPILVMPSTALNATINYDTFFGRAIYDQYRQKFNAYCVEHQLWCTDMWNALSPDDFTDSPLHHTAHGNQIIVVLTQQAIKKAYGTHHLLNF